MPFTHTFITTPSILKVHKMDFYGLKPLKIRSLWGRISMSLCISVENILLAAKGGSPNVCKNWCVFLLSPSGCFLRSVMSCCTNNDAIFPVQTRPRLAAFEVNANVPTEFNDAGPL